MSVSTALRSPRRVLILGGGFAGRAAAWALRGALRRGQCRVILLDAKPFTTMVPVLPDFAAGLIAERYVCAPLEPLLPAGVKFHREAVTQVDLGARRVTTARATHSYDYLILALGSVAAASAAGSGKEKAYPLTTYDDAVRLREAFRAYLHERLRPHVVISGAGYTGIELAAALRISARLAGKACRITLLERGPALLPFLNERQRLRVGRSLQRQHIESRTGCTIVSCDAPWVAWSTGERVRDVFLCRTEGTEAPVLPSGLDLDPFPDGRLPVTPGLSLSSYPDVYAAGDAAAFRCPNGCLRKAVNFAIYTGSRAGANIARCLAGRRPRAFHPVDLGWVIPLGDDSVGRALGGVPLQGRMGLGLHYFMCGVRNYSVRNLLFFTGRAVSAAVGNGQHRRNKVSRQVAPDEGES